jgi:hypothetical protein
LGVATATEPPGGGARGAGRADLTVRFDGGRGVVVANEDVVRRLRGEDEDGDLRLGDDVGRLPPVADRGEHAPGTSPSVVTTA